MERTYLAKRAPLRTIAKEWKMTPVPQTTPAWDAFAAPVAIQACRVEVDSAGGPMNTVARGPLIAGIEVQFVNRSPRPASEVVFRISAANLTQDVRDDGKFSPGVTIKTVFYEFAGRDYWRAEPDQCEVLRVRYPDGAVWQAKSHLR